jgi:hypothetical protein
MLTSRPGTASIELVMVLPVLLVLCGCILTVGHGGAARVTALGGARDGSWAKEPVADPGDVFRLNHDPDASLVEQEFREPFRGFGTLGGREWTATARTGAHFRTWTDDDVSVAIARAGVEPQSALLTLLVTQNADTMPHSAGALGALRDARFIDPVTTGPP